MEDNFMNNTNTGAIGEAGVLGMVSVLMVEVKVRSFLIWLFESNGSDVKFKHHDKIFSVIKVDELGYTSGKDEDGNKVHLSPRDTFASLPTSVIRYWEKNWLND